MRPGILISSRVNGGKGVNQSSGELEGFLGVPGYCNDTSFVSLCGCAGGNIKDGRGDEMSEVGWTSGY